MWDVSSTLLVTLPTSFLGDTQDRKVLCGVGKTETVEVEYLDSSHIVTMLQ